MLTWREVLITPLITVFETLLASVVGFIQPVECFDEIVRARSQILENRSVATKSDCLIAVQ